MFARATFIKVKPGCEVELTRTLKQEVIPLLRKEKDFRGLVAFTLPNGTKALSLSLWDRKVSAKGIWARGVGTFAALAKVVLGIPPAQVYEVSSSRFKNVGQLTGQEDVVEAPSDLRIYQSAHRPFRVSSPPHKRGRGFPLVRGLINSFSKTDSTTTGQNRTPRTGV